MTGVVAKLNYNSKVKNK